MSESSGAIGLRRCYWWTRDFGVALNVENRPGTLRHPIEYDAGGAHRQYALAAMCALVVISGLLG